MSERQSFILTILGGCLLRWLSLGGHTSHHKCRSVFSWFKPRPVWTWKVDLGVRITGYFYFSTQSSCTVYIFLYFLSLSLFNWSIGNEWLVRAGRAEPLTLAAAVTDLAVRSVETRQSPIRWHRIWFLSVKFLENRLAWHTLVLRDQKQDGPSASGKAPRSGHGEDKNLNILPSETQTTHCGSSTLHSVSTLGIEGRKFFSPCISGTLLP